MEGGPRCKTLRNEIFVEEEGGDNIVTGGAGSLDPSLAKNLNLSIGKVEQRLA